MKRQSKSNVLSVIVGIVLLLFSYNRSFAQVCPHAKPDLDSTYAGIPVTVNLGVNDSVGPTTPTPLITITSGPNNGVVTIINGDSVVYTPNIGFVGNDFFFYTVCDTPSGCGCASSQVVIRVLATPCTSVISLDDNRSIYSGEQVLVNFLTNDDAGLLRFFSNTSIISSPNYGSYVLIGLDSLIYSSDSNYEGIDTIVYAACNDCGKCDTAFIFITSRLRCALPIVINDSLNLESGDTSTINVALNDVSDSTLNTVSIYTNPLHGTASIIGTIITYSSNAGYIGTDSILYIICSVCGCDTGVVYITNREVCIPPQATDDIGATGYSPLCSQLFNVTFNDIGNSLTTTIISGPSHGTALVSGTSIDYSSDSTLFAAFDTILYTISNTCGIDTGSLFIFVNPTYPCNGFQPQINSDTIRVCRNDDSTIINARANDLDLDGDYITISALTILPTNGNAYILNDSQIVYKSDSAFFGVDSIYYQACDDGNPVLCATTNIFIVIDECRNAPHIVDSSLTDIDTMIINLAEDTDSLLCVKVYDIDGDNITTSIIGVWENGTISNITDTCILIHPTLNQVGSDTVILIACDDRDNLCDTVVLIINVSPVNDAPVANPDIIIYPGSSVVISPINNDFDPDLGDSISISFVVNLNPNAGIISVDSLGNVTFTADSSFVGIDTIVYFVCDNNGACDTTAILVFVGPTANPDHATTPMNASVNISLLTNDITSINTVANLCSNASNGSVTIVNGIATYTPNNGYIGNDEFCYVICDTITGLCDTSMAHIVVQNNLLFIPQGFSPNGDGINDFFNITGIENYPNAEVTIYNRWGDEVWANGVSGYKNNMSDGFIGKNKQDGILPDGTYYYVVKFNVEKLNNQAGYIQIHR